MYLAHRVRQTRGEVEQLHSDRTDLPSGFVGYYMLYMGLAQPDYKLIVLTKINGV